MSGLGTGFTSGFGGGGLTSGLGGGALGTGLGSGAGSDGVGGAGAGLTGGKLLHKSTTAAGSEWRFCHDTPKISNTSTPTCIPPASAREILFSLGVA
ncbi:MAG TPA: hypothetical protein VFI62_01145 [Burkholderiales bacterium]|nr:hypothetical protein [Burkholderiales bacterium]